MVIVRAATILAVRVLASAAHALASDLNREVERSRGGWRILEDREPCSTIAVADAEVERCIVAPWVGRRTPLASILDGDTLRVDVVLRGSVAALPVVVVVRVWAGEVGSGAPRDVERDRLSFGTWVVGTADGYVVRELILHKDRHLRGTSHAEALRHAWVGEVKFASLAQKTTDGLTSRALGGWPLGLLVAGRASVRTVAALSAGAAATTSGGLNITEAASVGAGVLNTSPAT